MSWADHGTASDERRGGCERASARSRLWIGSSTPPQTGRVRLKLWQASTHLGDGPLAAKRQPIRRTSTPAGPRPAWSAATG
jgi:hypothetical protein